MSTYMTVSQVAQAAKISAKALRGYEELGLVAPTRAKNGYRMYDAHQAAVAAQVSHLNSLGIALRDMRPFVDCLNTGSAHADDCPSTLSEYRRAIDRIDRTVSSLTAQRNELVGSLAAASARMVGEYASADAANPNLAPLPADLPEPEDDGAADGLRGAALPAIEVPSTDGDSVDLSRLGELTGRTLIYVFPMTGAPDQDMPQGWDAVPGARGCSSQSCDMRDHYVELLNAGVDRVYGLSSQPLEYQQAVVEALRLPYPLLSDTDRVLASDPGLPTLSAGDLTLFARMAFLVSGGVIEHVFYPIFPPNAHARVVLDWLANNPAG